MPIPGARYRFKQTGKGAVRLAFKKNKAVEAKPYKRTKTGLKPKGPAKRLGHGGKVTKPKMPMHKMPNGHMMRGRGMH